MQECVMALSNPMHHLNTLTVDGEYFRLNRENLPLPIQMQLSKKPETFCYFLLDF